MKSTNSLRTSFYTTVGALLLTLSSFAQAPEKMSYQAVIRDASNTLVTNQQVGMQISILQGSTAVYEETQTPTSNTNGLVSLEIGTGTVISGSFTAIDWSSGTYFIKTETDPAGGTNYAITGTSQLLSVPYALYANTSSDSSAVAANTAAIEAEATAARAAEVANTAAIEAEATTARAAEVTNSDAIEAEAITARAAEVANADAIEAEAITARAAEVANADAIDAEATTARAAEAANEDAIKANTAKIAIPTGESGDLLTNDGTNWVATKLSIQAHESQTINIRNPYLGINYIIALQGVYPSRSSTDPFLAEIIMFGGNFAPKGWALCNGQIITINDNTALFSFLGTTYGGDGRSTFGLPDLRGRTPVHPSTDPGLSQVQLGQTGGSESITIPAQTHVITYE